MEEKKENWEDTEYEYQYENANEIKREATHSGVPWCNAGNFKAIVAIDFGTDGTAMALTLTEGEEIYRISDWNDSGICDRNDQADKTKTALLLDENHNVIAFGNLAIAKYSADNQKGKSKWLLFEKFKMNLYESNEYTNKKVNVKMKLESANKISLKSEIVFVGALQYCKKIIMQYIENKKFYINEKDIQWILTVPAIWSEHAKYLMKSWAQKANLFNPKIDNQLLIALEPECASMSIFMDIKNQELKNTKFNVGDCYLMLDLGAGTADMVCHEIIGSFEVKEIIGSSGGPWGSSYIDIRFEQILEEIFGKHLIHEFKVSHPKIFVELMRNFESSKQRFFVKQRKTKHSIQIPLDFDDFMSSRIEQDLEEFVSNYQFNNLSECCSYDHEHLSFSFEMWTHMFDELINKIIDHVKSLMSKNSRILKHKLKYLCLVGGFSQSLYLQKKINDEFQSKYKIIIPNKPILSVIQGAAQLGRISSFIKSRIVNKTYGIHGCYPIEEAKSHPKITEDHIRENKFIWDINNKEYVEKIFRVFVNKGDEVKVNEIVEDKYSARSKDAKTSNTIIYSSEERDPGVITGCQKLGEIIIEYPEDFDRLNDTYKVQFYFGNTMIRVMVSMKGKEYEGVEIKYDFDMKEKEKKKEY